MRDIIKTHMNILSSLYEKNNCNISFWLWNILVFLTIKKIWKYLVIFLLTLSVLCMLQLLLSKTLTININRKNLKSIIWSYYRINIIFLFRKKLDSSIVKIIIIRYLIYSLLSFSYKMIKCSWELYSCLLNEYRWGDIKNKDINFEIYYTFLQKALVTFIIKEFAQPQIFNPIEEIKVLGFNKKIIININD